jgi:hypothetical protein
MSIRGQIAKALYERRNRSSPLPWDETPYWMKTVYLEDADAVISVLPSIS